MKIGTGPITGIQVLDEVHEIAKLLRSSGIDNLVVYCGWGSRLEINQLWTPIDIEVEEENLKLIEETKRHWSEKRYHAGAPS